MFYIVVELAKHFITDSSISFEKSQIIYLLLFNKPFVIAGQLWFLFALLYVYIMYAVVQRFNLYKIAYISIPIFMLGYIILAQGLHLAGKSVPNMIYRNFLFEGFPFFMLGHLMHHKEDKICNYFKNNVLLILLAFFTLLCLGERYVMGRDFGVNICTFPQVICIFILGMKNPANFEQHILRKIGTKLSMFVYIIHPFVWHTLEFAYEFAYSKVNLYENIAALYLMPILVLIVTLILSAILVSILKLYKKKTR